ncbi:MAG TPA: shikimate kinase [Candidatus Thermoplasmatota archaeon]|nr:shikimate kinase [Candidatus Thermoplasmatota archaeon]
MKGRARARGAVSVVNAIATGRGASMAIDLPLTATVTLHEHTSEIRVTMTPDASEDPRLAQEVVRAVCARVGVAYGADIHTESAIPVSRGLKSSSAAANAIGLATNAALAYLEGKTLPEREVLEAGIDAALKAGVTVTGAYDDACASLLGGLCVTDNRERRLFHRHEMPDGLQAVLLIPPAKTRKSSVKGLPYGAIAPMAALAHDLVMSRRVNEAMTLNGLAYGPLYGVDPQLTVRSLEAGALSASVSGTGPAFAALAPPDALDRVKGALSQFPGDLLVVPVTNKKAEVLPC